MNKKIVHQPLEGILNRELAIASAKPVIDKFSPYLTELVNYSTALLARCEKSLKGHKGTPASLIHIYYHAIQMADGIDALASLACFAAATPLHRSLLEATISMNFILDDDFDERSTSWMVGSYLNEKKYWEYMEPSTQKGHEFQDKMKVDRFVDPDLKLELDIPAIKRRIESINLQLNKPRFVNVTKKFRGNKGIRKWYQINGGPLNMAELMDRLNRNMEYKVFYKPASEMIHASDSHRMLELLNGNPSMRSIRPGTDSLRALYVSTGALLGNTSLMIAEKLRPDEKVKEFIRDILLRHRPDAGK